MGYVVAAILGGAGAWLGDKYDAFADLPVPQWFHGSNTTAVAIVSGIVAAVIMLAAGFLGGVAGARYHARADEYLASEQRDLLTHDAPIAVLDDGAGRRPEDRAERRFDTDERAGADRSVASEGDIDLRRLEVDDAQARRADEQRRRSIDPSVAGPGPVARADVSRNGPRRGPGR